jgi:hypothetical protein
MTPDMQCLQISFFRYGVIMVFHILKKSIVAKCWKFSLYALQFIGVSNCNRVPSNRSILQLDITKSKYNISRLSKVEK